MALNTTINRQKLIQIYPDLRNDSNFQILSPRTPVYNCIAWAMDYTDRWVEPCDGPGFWWPNGATRDYTAEALIEAFEAEGFELAQHLNPEEGFSKVILYKNEVTETWTHASKVISDDVKYSKFGQSWDGHHSHGVLCNTEQGYEDYSYGVPYAFMKRRIVTKEKTALSGNVSIDIDLFKKLKAKLGK